MYYYYTLVQPPFFLLFFGLFVGLTCGAAFEGGLKTLAQSWSQDPTLNVDQQIRSIEVLMPYFGICLGIMIFLASGLEIFALTRPMSYLVSAVITTLTAGFILRQLRGMLIELQKGGSRAIDLDQPYDYESESLGK